MPEESFSTICSNLTTARVVHAYAGNGRWTTTPAHELSRALGPHGVVCDTLGELNDRHGAWHSQDGQDRRVQYILERQRDGSGVDGNKRDVRSTSRRFFIDLAANRPITYSNSRALERDYGWRGLCIDGHVGMLHELARKRTCKVVHAIVSNATDNPVRFRRFASAPWHGQPLHAMSGIVGKDMSNRLDNRTCWGWGRSRPCVSTRWTAGTIEERAVSIAFADLLRRHHAPRTIDYLSLDVEGAEESVLIGFPFSEWRFRTLSIERPSDRLRGLLTGHGYGHVCNNGAFYGDELWIHRALIDLPRVFPRPARWRTPTVCPHLHEASVERAPVVGPAIGWNASTLTDTASKTKKCSMRVKGPKSMKERQACIRKLREAERRAEAARRAPASPAGAHTVVPGTPRP